MHLYPRTAELAVERVDHGQLSPLGPAVLFAHRSWYPGGCYCYESGQYANQ